MESMVAAMVFAVGAIGATGIQLMAARTNLEAAQRTQAVYFATDIIERMLNNATALDDYDASGNTQWTAVGSGSTQTEPTPDCDSAHCTPTQQAAHDLWAWEQALDGDAMTTADNVLAGGLINPTGCIRNGSDGRVEIAIAWRGRGSMTNSGIASGCTAQGRYGSDDEYRRVLHLRTFIADTSQ